MRIPRISQSQLELLATRLAAVGVGRRDFLRVAAGLAAIGAAGFNARAAAAAPKLAPGEKLAREQHLRFGGGSWFRTTRRARTSTKTSTATACRRCSRGS